MYKLNFSKSLLGLALVLTTGLLQAYELSQSKNSIVFSGLDKNNKLIVTSPNGFRKSFTINSDQFTLTAGKMGNSKFVDGQYKFEIVPHYNSGYLASQVRKSNNASLANDYAATYKNKQSNQSGVFTIAKHDLVVSSVEDSTKDQQILDDLIVDGSACIGQDCVNGESFGFDTLRLKENNLRIKFQDTSNSASFPTNDWQLTANDSSNGGANKFSIDDIDHGRTPFTVEAGARNNAIYIDDGGKIGVGTATPVVEMHIVDGDSPTLRLEQDGSSGFTPQTWDVAGNETNFFVRDATNGSKLPFKIRPSAPDNSLYINTNGNIGLGTASPDAKLHVNGDMHVTGNTQLDGAIQFSSLDVSGSAGTAKITVEETNTTSANRTLLDLSNNGGSRIDFTNNSSPFAISWSAFSDSATESFIIAQKLSSSIPFQISKNGDIIQEGVTLHTSDRNKKKNINAVDPKTILNKVSQLPISTWQYKKQTGEVKHMGPMAQDFRASFGLGLNDVTISDTDLSGVALAAIKALKSELDHRETEMKKLQANNAQLEQRLFNLEAKLFAKEKSVVQQ